MKQVVALTSLILICSSLSAQKSEVFISGGKAIHGYDPVAYFTEKKPVEGVSEFSYEWHDANWYFSSRENLMSFKSNPEKYAPQYGGYCAYGLAKGYKATTDPDAWTITNDKLYLNYSKSISETWNKDRAAYILKADQNWPDVKNKK